MTKKKVISLFSEYLKDIQFENRVEQTSIEEVKKISLKTKPIIQFLKFLEYNQTDKIIELFRNRDITNWDKVSKNDLNIEDNLFLYQFSEKFSPVALLAFLGKSDILKQIGEIDTYFFSERLESKEESEKSKELSLFDGLYASDDVAIFKTIKNIIPGKNFLEQFAKTSNYLDIQADGKPHLFVPPQKILKTIFTDKTAQYHIENKHFQNHETREFLLKNLSEETKKVLIKNHPNLAIEILKVIPDVVKGNHKSLSKTSFNQAMQFIKLCLEDKNLKNNYLTPPLSQPLWVLFFEASNCSNSYFIQKISSFNDLKQEAIEYYKMNGFSKTSYGNMKTIHLLEKLGVDLSVSVNGINFLHQFIEHSNMRYSYSDLYNAVNFCKLKHPQLLLDKNKDGVLILEQVSKILKEKNFLSDGMASSLQKAVLDYQNKNYSNNKIKVL